VRECCPEIFKDIPEYEGLYQISNHGTVKSLSFRNNVSNIKREKTLKPFNNGHGYLLVNLRRNGTRKNYYVHRLVADAFLNRDSTKTVVNHKDYNTLNNHACNLEWCTVKENVSYSANRMRREKSRCKPSNTGEKYISRYKNGFRVYIRKIGICKQFKCLDCAVAFRNEVMRCER